MFNAVGLQTEPSVLVTGLTRLTASIFLTDHLALSHTTWVILTRLDRKWCSSSSFLLLIAIIISSLLYIVAAKQTNKQQQKTELSILLRGKAGIQVILSEFSLVQLSFQQCFFLFLNTVENVDKCLSLCFVVYNLVHLLSPHEYFTQYKSSSYTPPFFPAMKVLDPRALIGPCQSCEEGGDLWLVGGWWHRDELCLAGIQQLLR